MTYGQFNILDTRRIDGKIAIIKQIPNRNMCWEIYIPDAGKEAERICRLLNKDHELHSGPTASSAEDSVIKGVQQFDRVGTVGGGSLGTHRRNILEPQGPEQIKEALGFDQQ